MIGLIYKSENSHHCFATYSHRVLHVSDGRGELAEVQLGAVDQRVSEVATAAAGAHTCNLPLFAVSHHSCMVLPRGNALDTRNKKKVPSS